MDDCSDYPNQGGYFSIDIDIDLLSGSSKGAITEAAVATYGANTGD